MSLPAIPASRSSFHDRIEEAAKVEPVPISQNSIRLIARALETAGLGSDLVPQFAGCETVQVAPPPCVLGSSSLETIPRF